MVILRSPSVSSSSRSASRVRGTSTETATGHSRGTASPGARGEARKASKVRVCIRYPSSRSSQRSPASFPRAARGSRAFLLLAQRVRSSSPAASRTSSCRVSLYSLADSLLVRPPLSEPHGPPGENHVHPNGQDQHDPPDDE